MRKVQLPEFDLARTVNIGCSDVVRILAFLLFLLKARNQMSRHLGL